MWLQDQRVPADMVLLRTTEKSGACFIRTDQLDGETDWKLRVAVQDTQRLPSNAVSLYSLVFLFLVWNSGFPSDNFLTPSFKQGPF